MTACTGELMNLQSVYNRVVEFLRNLIAIFDENSYHRIRDVGSSHIWRVIAGR